MSLFGREDVRDGGSFVELGDMIIPSALMHLVILGLMICLPTFSFKKTSHPSFHMVSLVSAPSDAPSKVRKKSITKEVGKTKPVSKKIEHKRFKKTVKKVAITPAKKKAPSKKISAQKVVGKAIKRTREAESSRKISDAVSRIRGEVSRQPHTGTSPIPAQGGVIASERTDLRFKIYYTIIWGKIKEGWILPEGFVRNREDLEAVISFRILRDGKIKDVKFENPSGNAYFDKSVLRAVEKANPLPPLPGGYREKYLDIGVRFHSSEW